MRNIFFTFLFIVFFINRGDASTDTVRYYNKVLVFADVKSNDPAQYPQQYARFEPVAPGYVNAIGVVLKGAGTVNVTLMGHAAGNVSAAIFEQPLTVPKKITKTTSGIELIYVNLASPVWMDNNQFFVKIDSFSSSSIRLLSDTLLVTPGCQSGTGGDFYWQSAVFYQGGIYVSKSAYGVEVVMNYPNGTTSPSLFNDATTIAGLPTVLSNNSICWSDLNKDGHLDLLLENKLYKNNGNGTFTDVSSIVGINNSYYVNTFIDMNNDGKDDILFLDIDSSKLFLYINNGSFSFTKKKISLTTKPFEIISSISVADLNNDKYPDLFVGQLWTSFNPNLGIPNYFYLNDQNLGFTNASAAFYPPNWTHRVTRGSMFTDYNDDNYIDLYVSNYRLMRDELWRNNANGTFTEITFAKGLDKNWDGSANNGTGCDWTDYDADGDLDLLLPNFLHPWNVLDGYQNTKLYSNSGAPDYDFVRQDSVGIQYEETHGGATWGDFNSDGLMDFYITAFYGCRFSDLYMQNPDHTFSMKTWEHGINESFVEDDAVVVDYNNDGKPDLCSAESGYLFRLYKNAGTYNNHYVAIDLASTSGNAMAIGAKVIVYVAGKAYTQWQFPGHGSLMVKSNRLFFGLGNATSIDSVEVRWPNQTQDHEVFTNVNIDELNSLTEGTGVYHVSANKTLATIITELKVYPNPVSGTAVTFNYFIKQHVQTTITLYNVLGQPVVSSSYYQQPGEQQVVVDANLPSGLYSYIINLNGDELRGKLVVE